MHVEMLLLLSYKCTRVIDNLVKWNQTRLSKYFKNKTYEKPRKLGKYCGNMTVGTVFIFILYYHIVSIVFYFFWDGFLVRFYVVIWELTKTTKCYGIFQTFSSSFTFFSGWFVRCVGLIMDILYWWRLYRRESRNNIYWWIPLDNRQLQTKAFIKVWAVAELSNRFFHLLEKTTKKMNDETFSGVWKVVFLCEPS